ncbi:MAG: hypothetical protein H0Z19_07400 [Archaeoglobus sp.]|uniref:hypothetical protein n=1 Tax=Archaeoglobus sp. TaxID=1872626 RepID=UPI001D41F803|nr:hypothetical protein [Archaeoglobus sp.]MBO8180290.1 hypothetical protein [Archaeoglobus sp.]
MRKEEVRLISDDVVDKWKRMKKYLKKALYHFHVADMTEAHEEVRQAYRLVEQIERELKAAPRVRVELEEE